MSLKVNADVPTIKVNAEVSSVSVRVGTQKVYDVSTSDATATEDDIHEGKTAYANGRKLTGRAKVGGLSEADVTALIEEKTEDLQPKTDDSLKTDSKEIIGAINELHDREEQDPTVPAWAKEKEKPTYSYEEIKDKPDLFSGNYNDLSNKPTIPSVEGLATEEYADNVSAQAVSQGVTTHNVSQDTHKDIRNLISELSNRLNAIADSDDKTLDQLSEIVAYIKANKALIESVTTSKVNVSDIVNDLETNVVNKPLSASQGVALKALINALEKSVSDLETNAVSGIGSAVAEETNELTIELKDKNGKVIATTKVTLPTQEIPEVDLSGYVKNTDRDSFVIGGLTENAQTLTPDEKTSACDFIGAFPRPIGAPSGIAVPAISYNPVSSKYMYGYQNVGTSQSCLPLYYTNANDMSAAYGYGVTLYVDTPKGKKQAVNKEYVDDLVGDIESVLNAILGV